MPDHLSNGSVRRMRNERSATPTPPNIRWNSSERPDFRDGAKALITDRNRVLLVKECHSDGSTFWTLPGGGVKSGESFSACLRRELREEIQCRATVNKRLGQCVYRHMSRPVTTVYTVFDVTLRTEPESNTTEGVLDYAWLDPTELLSTTLSPVERFIDRSVTKTDEGE